MEKKKTQIGESKKRGIGKRREKKADIPSTLEMLDFIYICGYLYVWIYENDVQELVP